MTEIRRILDDGRESERVVELWDRMCRETPDGGPLTRTGRRNLDRMLAMTAWHERSFCLVAVDAGVIVGFVCGRLETGDGLLPGAVGELNELYVEPDHPDARSLPGRLLEAAIAQLRVGGEMWTIRSTFDVDDRDRRGLLEQLGFEADMITMSLYAAE
jgi:hypothetical protein